MVVIPSSPARSTPRHQGDGSISFHRCVQFGLGSPVRLTLDTGTVVSISTIVPHKRSGDAGCPLCCERLPTSAEVPSGEIDVRQRSDSGVHQERGGARSHTLMQMTIRLLKWCNSKAITLVPVHLPGVHNIQADSLSRVSQTLTTEWTMAMESLRLVFAKWGEPQIDLFATFANRRLVKFVSPYPDPRVEWTDAMSMPWGDKERGLLYAFPPFKMVPQALQKIAQSPGVEVILIAQLQPAASWFPELMDLSQEDPIPLFVEGQDLLTQDVWTADGVTETHHFRPSNLRAWKLSGPSWELRVISGKLPTWCQGAYENLHNKCMNLIGQDSWRSVGRWHVFRVRSHHFSTYMMHLFRDGLRPLTIISHRTSVASVLRHWVYDPAADPHIKLLVRAFRLERPVQRRIMPKWDLHLVLLSLLRPPFTSQSDKDGESSDDVIPLKWRTLKCVFLLALASGKTALVPAHIEYSAWQMCVRERLNANLWYLYFRNLASWRRISFLRRPLSGSRYWGLPTWIRRNRRKCYVPLDSWSSTYGTQKESGGPSVHVHSLEPQHQGYHEEPHKPMDRGDCQGSLQSSWSSVRPCDSTWGPSTVSFMGVQLSGGFTWHPVSGVLEVIWSFPEFIPARHGLYRWWHVDTGSSGGCTTRSGSRASSPTSIAYTICMQPLLPRS